MNFTKREIKKGSESGGVFVRLGDGESITGVCRGEVYEFHQKWVDGKSHVVTAKDPDGKSRFRVNLVIQENGKFIAKIFEFGVTIYNQLADIHEECSLPETKIKIKRRGTGTDTEYSVLPIMKEPLSEKQLKEISALPLNILEHRGSQDVHSA